MYDLCTWRNTYVHRTSNGYEIWQASRYASGRQTDVHITTYQHEHHAIQHVKDANYRRMLD